MSKRLLTLLLLSPLVLAAGAEEKKQAVVEYNADSFKESVGKEHHFVMFYAPWCGHCKRLHPTWEDLAKEYNEKDPREVVVAKVDCTVETALCSDQDVTGYPTLKFFKVGDEEAEKYRGQRDLVNLNKFVGQKIGREVEEIVLEPEDATVEKGLYILNDRSFAQHIKTGDHFIKFYAPWCGHCQKLAPTWDELAQEFEDDKVVKVAKLDCTVAQSICQDNEIKGYPTLAYFRNGKKLETYRGARSLPELRDFLKSMQENAGKDADQEKDRVPTEDAGAKGPVVHLDKDSFADTAKKGVTFVKFFAPWCGHCKRLAPTWDELAKAYEGVDGVTIAKVDCTSGENKNKDLCNEHGVNGFPTLNIYKDGEKAAEYEGKRDLEQLKEFVDKHLKGEDKKKDEL